MSWELRRTLSCNTHRINHQSSDQCFLSPYLICSFCFVESHQSRASPQQVTSSSPNVSSLLAAPILVSCPNREFAEHQKGAECSTANSRLLKLMNDCDENKHGPSVLILSPSVIRLTSSPLRRPSSHCKSCPQLSFAHFFGRLPNSDSCA